MPQIPAAIATQAFELIRNRIAEILADELPAQATFSGDSQVNATVYVERFVQFDLTELPAVNVSLNRDSYSEQTQRNTDGEHTFSVDVYCSAKSTSSVRGDSLAMFRLQKLLGVCRGILEDSRYKTLGFAPPFIESRKVTTIEYATPTQGDGTSSVQGRITFVVRAPDRNGVVTPELIAGYDTQVKLGLTEKGYIFSGDNIPSPPITGSEVSVNDTFYADLTNPTPLDIPILNTVGNEVGVVSAGVGVEIQDARFELLNSEGTVLDTGVIPANEDEQITAPDVTVKLNTVTVATPASGTIEDIPVTDSALAAIGSWQDPNFVISDTPIIQNGTQIDVSKAETAFEFDTEVDGIPNDGVYNQGTKTLSFTSVPITVGGNPIKTGVTVSRRTGDDASMNLGANASWSVLDFTNPFGNTNRFTDTLGGQTYADNIVIVWSTYRQGKVLGYRRTHPTAGNWANQIDACVAVSIGIWTTLWHMTNRKEMEELMNDGVANPFNYAPFAGYIDPSAGIFTSTPYPSAPTAYAIAALSIGYVLAKDITEAGRSIPCRYFTVTGTTLT